MSNFLERMYAQNPAAADAAQRDWVFLPYDRQNDRLGVVANNPNAGILLVESHAKGKARPYHRKKVMLVLSSQRHFALEQIEKGRTVLYLNAPESFGEQLRAVQDRLRLGPILLSPPAERELRKDLETAQSRGLRLQYEPDTAWLSTEEDWDTVFGKSTRGRQYLMERFYRHMRQASGLLMDPAGKFAGGRLSFDEENRERYRGQIPVPQRPAFPIDDITREVVEMIDRLTPHTLGTSEGFDLPVTARDVDTLWQFALKRLLPFFGPYEDAMDSREPVLFHSAMSALLNVSRLLASDIVHDVEAEYRAGKIPLASAEGFIRQILGWREFMRHMHRVTDGFRTVEQSPDPLANRQANKYSPMLVKKINAAEPDRPATPSALDAHLPLPPAYWGERSGMFCLDTVVAQVMQTGWSHHITRLMVLSNLAVLCGFSPRELTDWFWISYVDAYDWVVEPNVLGMATFADGGLTATKPYVSGAAYINRMSNYCGQCALYPKKSTGEGSCPFTALYWSFLERHSDLLSSNQRMRMPYNTLSKKTAQERTLLRERAQRAVDQLERGEIVT